MKIHINFLITAKKNIDKNKLKKTIELYLENKNVGDIISLDVMIVDKTRIQKLNKKYRQLDSATDVLSFPVASPAKEKIGVYNLGSVIICPEIVRNNALAHKLTFEAEMDKIVIHSLNHLWNQR